ncbi:MAG: sigma-54-dependent Fis family transcriptional regulator [Bacteroidetes bacterium]|jgi:DNA-binding NtrC family response regulator|nr:sigma-54-dependent Fis family transcriptional regulator [Bacteroidota bacterium]
MNPKTSILIIDDEEKFRQLLARIISLEGYAVSEAASIQQGLKILQQEKPDIVLTDVKLPDGNGIDILEKIRSVNPLCECIVMTAFGTIHDGVKAMKQGATDYFVKGDDNEQIIPALSRASEKIALKKRVLELENKLEARYGFETIIGGSAPIRETVALAKKVAATDSTVLLEGETGVGKELFAQAIHYAGPRRNNSFVAVNCSSFARDLLESELFGHKKGAFTGALADKKGLFEEASNGTIFLDEMGEMESGLQARLLRVLETQSFIKVGDTKSTKVNVRIIAATNRDLKKESENGNFRSDLYYRLSAFKITIPSLKERKEDIEELAKHFMNVYAVKLKKRITGMERDFLASLQKNQWRGNIRELKNCIERATILADTNNLTVDLLPVEIINEEPRADHSYTSLTAMEKIHIAKILVFAKGNKTRAAELLGIGLTTLYRKMEEYGIEK